MVVPPPSVYVVLLSSIAGTKQILSLVSLNFSPLRDDSQVAKTKHASFASVVWLWSLTTSPVKR